MYFIMYVTNPLFVYYSNEVHLHELPANADSPVFWPSTASGACRLIPATKHCPWQCGP